MATTQHTKKQKQKTKETNPWNVLINGQGFLENITQAV